MQTNTFVSRCAAGRFFFLAVVSAWCVSFNANGQTPEQKEPKSWAVPNISAGAEFYFSPDGTHLIGNAKLGDDQVHHVYTFNIDGTDIKKINGEGEDACSYYFSDGKHILFTSTRDHLDMPNGNYSDPNDYPQGAELYLSDLNGGNIKRLTNNTMYDAEVSVSPDGKWILFSRQTDGKIDLWLMRPDGSGQKQVTRTPEWQEGGAFFWDDTTIIYRAWNINAQAQRGMPMTIFTIRTNGTGVKQITTDGGTNWAPFPAPDGEHFAFVKVLPPHNYEIYLMSLKTGKQTRITYNDAFDGFPAFSPDGRYLTFDSSRDNKPGDRSLKPYIMDVSAFDLGPRK